MTSLITTLPGSAACWIRAARLGTSPTIESRSATEPSSLRSVTTTRPVWMPDPDLGGDAERRSSSARASRIAVDEVEAGEHGAAGVVLVRVGVAEAGEDAVAGVLHERGRCTG